MIDMTCLICDEAIKTHDVAKAVAFDREHTAMHAEAIATTHPDTQHGQEESER